MTPYRDIEFGDKMAGNRILLMKMLSPTTRFNSTGTVIWQRIDQVIVKNRPSLLREYFEFMAVLRE